MTAQLEGNLYQGKHDPAWITEYEKAVIGWIDMPEAIRG